MRRSGLRGLDKRQRRLWLWLGVEIFEARHLRRHDFHGDWNYTISATAHHDTTHANQGK